MAAPVLAHSSRFGHKIARYHPGAKCCYTNQVSLRPTLTCADHWK